MADHPDPNYVCLNDPACMNRWDGYYSPSHSARCAEKNGQAGPKINGNPERLERHELIGHSGAEVATALNRTLDVGSMLLIFTNLMHSTGWEGIVWHHPDGRMAKLKMRDIKTPNRVI